MPEDTSPLTDAPPRDVYRLAAELIPGIGPDFPRTVPFPESPLREGRTDDFWLADLDQLRVYQSRFTLALVSPNAYWYVEEGQRFDRENLERSAKAFEEQIYPRVTSVFGQPEDTGVDEDPRITIINGALKGVAGYYNSSDQYLRAIFRYSNQREMIYVNSQFVPIGSSAYHATLAHELQHLVHWSHDSSEDTWVNEGLSELATSVAGFTTHSLRAYTGGIPTSLVNWPVDSTNIAAHYGAAGLFMQYLAEHYGSRDDMRALVETAGDGIPGINAWLRDSGHDVSFQDVFRDWAIANYLDLPKGVYGYPVLHVRARTNKFIEDHGKFESEIPQYAVEYVGVESVEVPVRVRFSGPAEARLLPVDPGPEGCWWSNAGDAIDSTLTHLLDLSAMDRPTLRYEVWYDLEEDWDYSYLQVSLDGGATWQVLEAPGMSPENPMGTGFGTGYTGSSDGWATHSVDLSALAGQDIQVRFQYITDDAVHGPGLCLRRMGIIHDQSVQPLTDWRPNGFVFINNAVPQRYIVQIIEGKHSPTVREMPLDGTNSGSLEISNPDAAERLVVVVAALAPKTFQPAPYSLTVSRME